MGTEFFILARGILEYLYNFNIHLCKAPFWILPLLGNNLFLVKEIFFFLWEKEFHIYRCHWRFIVAHAGFASDYIYCCKGINIRINVCVYFM